MIYLNYLGFYKLNSMSIKELQKEILNGNKGEIFYWALKCNRLDVIKLIDHSIIYTYVDKIINVDIVAELGYFDMLIWLYDNTMYNFTCKAIHLAAANGYIKIVQFLYNNIVFKSELNIHIINAIISAAKNSNIEIVKWLYYNTDTFPSTKYIIENACLYKSTPLLNWLKDEVCLR